LQARILSWVLIFVYDHESVICQTDAYRIGAAGRKRRAVDGSQGAIWIDVKHGDGIRSRVHGKELGAVGVFDEILIGIERTESERRVENSMPPAGVVLISVGLEVKLNRNAKIELPLVLLLSRLMTSPEAALAGWWNAANMSSPVTEAVE
jgi:hypothetical protein